jgi:hypothetical protein
MQPTSQQPRVLSITFLLEIFVKDVTIELCGGIHEHREVLILDALDGGVEGAPVTYKSAPGESAVLDSGVRVAGWSLVNESQPRGIWHAPIPTAADAASAWRQLWVNGRRAVRGRAGNRTTAPGGNVFDGGNATVTSAGYAFGTDPILRCPGCPAVPLSQWLVSGAELVFHEEPFLEARCGVAAVNRISGGRVEVVMQQPCWSMGRSKWGKAIEFPEVVENCPALVDEPGEWVVDSVTRNVLYVPLPSDALDSVDAVLGAVPSGSDGAAVVVQEGVKHLHFEDLGFRHQSWLGPSTGVSLGLLRA